MAPDPPGDTGRGRRAVLALLPEERAGRISTANAGAVRFEASLQWRPGDDIPEDPILDELHAPGARLYSLVRADGAASSTRRVSCEIRALGAEPLAGALDGALRSVTAYAALAGAVLETRAVRLADPVTPNAALVEGLARQLWSAGLPVSFGPSWSPVPGAGISVGTKGLKSALETFSRNTPSGRLPDNLTVRLDKRGASG